MTSHLDHARSLAALLGYTFCETPQGWRYSYTGWDFGVMSAASFPDELDTISAALIYHQSLVHRHTHRRAALR